MTHAMSKSARGVCGREPSGGDGKEQVGVSSNSTTLSSSLSQTAGPNNHPHSHRPSYNLGSSSYIRSPPSVSTLDPSPDRRRAVCESPASVRAELTSRTVLAKAELTRSLQLRPA